jgi:hypothetical protein
MAFLRALVLLAGTLATVTASAATVTQQLDFLLLGDDPFQEFDLTNPFLGSFPLELSFIGVAQRLNVPPYENDAVWVSTSGGQLPFELDTFTVPAADPPVQVPIAISRTFANAPNQIHLLFEGTGPGDQIHIAGTLTQSGTVPEPSTLAMLLAVVPLGYCVFGDEESPPIRQPTTTRLNATRWLLPAS